MSSRMLTVAPDDLKPNPWNPNVVAPGDAEKLRNSVENLGMFKPLIVRERSDGSLEIIGGQHRWQAARELGHETVPVFNLGRIDDAQAKKIGLADNARYGADDTLALAKIFKELDDWDPTTQLPIDEADLTAIFDASSIDLSDLDDLEEPESNVDDAIDGAERAPQTHRIVRFKIAIADAERVVELIEAVKIRQGLTQSDDLTNAGDALTHLLFEERE